MPSVLGQLEHRDVVHNFWGCTFRATNIDKQARLRAFRFSWELGDHGLIVGDHRPDAILALEECANATSEPATPTRLVASVEADRATESPSRVRAKCQHFTARVRARLDVHGFFPTLMLLLVPTLRRARSCARAINDINIPVAVRVFGRDDEQVNLHGGWYRLHETLGDQLGTGHSLFSFDDRR